MNGPLQLLADAGVSIWLDDLNRKRLVSGDLDRLVREVGITGVTTNPSIFEQALRDSGHYDDELPDFVHRGSDASDVARALACSDVQAACDVLRPVYEASGGRDGRVSIEVDPGFAYDAERTEAEAKLLWSTVDRPNAMIKIPATRAGLRAVTRCLAQGLSVNVTLIFSAQRYPAVLDSYFAGLEEARDNGWDLSVIGSVASFFISRVDTEVDRLLDRIDGKAAHTLRGRAAIANATLAYETYRQSLRDPRWQALAAAGARPQRLLWASTGVKDPAYDDTRYVVDLVAPDTVNTVPQATLDAVLDHGMVRGDRLTSASPRARAVFAELVGLGIDLDEVGRSLERHGVEKFQESWWAVVAAVDSALARHRGRR